MTLTAEQLAHHAQSAFEDACPEDASGYEIGHAWKKVGEHLAALLVEEAEEQGTPGYLHLGKAGAALARLADEAAG